MYDDFNDEEEELNAHGMHIEGEESTADDNKLGMDDDDELEDDDDDFKVAGDEEDEETY